MIIRPTTTSYRKCRVKGQQTLCAMTFLTVAQNRFVPRLSLTLNQPHLLFLHPRIPFMPQLSSLSLLIPQTNLIQSP